MAGLGLAGMPKGGAQTHEQHRQVLDWWALYGVDEKTLWQWSWQRSGGNLETRSGGQVVG